MRIFCGNFLRRSGERGFLSSEAAAWHHESALNLTADWREGVRWMRRRMFGESRSVSSM